MSAKVKPAGKMMMWAVIVRGERSEWINWETIRRTRKDAWRAYCSMWENPEYPAKAKKTGRVRLASVIVRVNE